MSENPCHSCQKATSDGLLCDSCQHWWCPGCLNSIHPNSLPVDLYRHLTSIGEFPWKCPSCSTVSLPIQLALNGILPKETLQAMGCLFDTDNSTDNVQNGKGRATSSRATKDTTQSDNTSSAVLEMFKLVLQQQEFGRAERREEREEARKMEERRREEQRQEREDANQARKMEFDILLRAIQGNGQSVSTASSDEAYSQHSSTVLTTTKLPKISLPTFSGKRLEWPNYWESFDININSRQNLHQKQKMDYLLQTLKGTAYDKVKGLGLQGDRYPEAISILKKAYGDNKDLITANWEALYGLCSVKENSSNLEKFIDETRAACTSLRRYGVEVAALDGQVPFLLKKLPAILHRKLSEIAMFKDEDVASWSMEILLETLTKICKYQIQSHCATEPKKKNVWETEEIKPFSDHISAAALLQSAATKNRKRACIFCDGTSHFSDSCRTIEDPEERKEIAYKKRLCFKCLSPDHLARICRRNKECFHCKSKSHNSAFCLHRKKEKTKTEQHLTMINDPEKVTPEQPATLSAQPVQALLAAPNQKDGIVMASFPVRAKNIRTNQEAFLQLYLDFGARFTCISRATANRLNLKPLKHVSLETARFHSVKTEKVEADVVGLTLIGPKGFQLPVYAYSVDKMAPTLPIYPIKFDAKTKDFLAKINPLNLPPERPTKVPIDLLIGMDYWHQIMGPSAVPKILPIGTAMAVHYTPFGPILSGNYLTNSREKPLKQCRLAPVHTLFIDVPNQTSTLWSLEAVGIKDNGNTVEHNPITKTHAEFKSSITFEDGRYQVRWPWINKDPLLPTNFAVAKRRLHSTLRTLSPEPGNTKHLVAYNDILTYQSKKGIIEPVVPASTDGPLIHYISHFPVIRPDRSTTKIRIVYDASAKTSDGRSLNDLIYPGPNLMEDLTGMLLRFRIPPIVAMADIEKAFLQVGLQRCDRDCTRFLWVKDLLNPSLTNNIQIYRFTRIPFGVVASPFLLLATIYHHLDRNPGKVADVIKGNIYMDNIMFSAHSAKELFSLYKEVKLLFARAGMNIREWISNDQVFNSSLPPEDKSGSEITKVLGLSWNSTNDTINIKKLEPLTGLLTKRVILQRIAAAFDPLGFLTPITIKGKMLIQKLWQNKLPWDVEIPDYYKAEWYQIDELLQGVDKYPLPRKLPVNLDKPYKLLCFTDASQAAYAAAIYVWQKSVDDKALCSLVFAKARVAPLKSSMSMPRLELVATQVGMRALRYVEKQLQCPAEEYYLWTDSQIVLHWLQSSKTLQPHIQRRVDEIKANPPTIFSYVRSRDNPVDTATRGVCGSSAFGILLPGNTWLSGPPWLKGDPSTWKLGIPANSKPGPDCSRQFSYPVFQVSISKKKAEVCNPPFGISVTNFSSLPKLLRVTAYCKRFVDSLQKKPIPSHRNISTAEMNVARLMWLTTIQHTFEEQRQKLMQGGSDTLIKQLHLFIDDGLLRCGGRSANAPINYEARFPILLPKSNPYTALVIKDAHHKVYHFGARSTLSELRKNYWVPHGLTEVKKVIRCCLVCRKVEGGCFRPPIMPPLPKERLHRKPAFAYTGLDYLGPLFIKSKSREPFEKRWIAIFTCFVTRAVHLELIQDCSTEAALNAIGRFIGRRGTPVVILSDNAAQFKKCSTAISELWGRQLNADESEKLLCFFSAKGVTWKFIPERSPWFGGFYERLVRLVKRALRKALWKSKIDEDSLCTLVSEIEGILNTRPLLSPATDISDGATLIPANFIAPMSSLCMPPKECDSDDPNYTPQSTSQNTLLSLRDQIEKRLDQFWCVWQNYYLQELRNIQVSTFKKGKGESTWRPEKGKVYLIKQRTPRATWPLVRTVDVLHSADGEVRYVKVRLPSGNLTRRSIRDLIPLEASDFTEHPPAGGGGCQET